MDNDQFKLLRSRTGGQRITDTFTFLRLNLAMLFQTHVLLSFPVILISAGIFVLLFPDDFSLIRTIDSGPFVDTVSYEDSSYQRFIAYLFDFVAFIPIAINTLIVFDQYAKSADRKVKFDDVFASFRANFLKLYAAKLIMGALLGIACLFLVIPAFVFYTMFLCVEMLVLQHKYGIFKAMGRSWSIMNRGFGSSFLVNAGLFLIFGFAWLALNNMDSLMEFLAGLVTDQVTEGGVWMVIGRIMGVFNAALGYFLYVIPAAGTGIQYFTLREEIGKTDILQRIQAIGTKEKEPALNYLGDEQY